MNSIQQKAVEFVKKLTELDITIGLSTFIESGYEMFREYFMELASAKVEEVDENIAVNPSVRRGWTVQRKGDVRTLVTEHGELKYTRRYYKNEKHRDYSYLADRVIGVDKYERIERGLGAKLCNMATEQSYAKSSDYLCKGMVSRQSVLNKTRDVREERLEPVEQRKDVEVLHIQADEDHVALQDSRRSTIVKLVTIHEPVKFKGKRVYLPQRFSLVSYQENVDDFWLRVADEISKRYGDRDNLTVYIHGDGASWIRTGLGWIKNSRHVLDKYHLMKYMRPVCGGNETCYAHLWDALQSNDYNRLRNLVECMVNDGCCQEETGKEFLDYARKNWDGIRIWYEDRASGGSCTEGLVSHILSDRLSSRPKGWLDEGIETISRLRVYVCNGGTIKPDDVRKTRPARSLTKQAMKKLQKKMSEFEPMPSELFTTPKRGTALYRLFEGIKYGGMAI